MSHAVSTSDRLLHAGLRCTRQRVELYEALAASEHHPTADELYQTLAGAGMSLATVYNTLEAFCAAGLAQKLPGAGPGGAARFDACCHPHLHLRCRATGQVADVPEDLSRQLLAHLPAEVLRDLEERTGFQIEQIQIELTGHYQDQRDQLAPKALNARVAQNA